MRDPSEGFFVVFVMIPSLRLLVFDNSFFALACVCAPGDSILCDCVGFLVNQSHLELRQSFPRGERRP